MSERKREARAATRRQLMRWRNTLDTIDRLREESGILTEELAACYDLRAAKPSGTPGTGPGDPTGRAAIANEKKAKRLERDLEHVASRLHELQYYVAMIEDAVNGLPALECQIVRLRYVTYGRALKGFWPALAALIPVSVDYAKKLEARAVDRLSGIITDE